MIKRADVWLIRHGRSPGKSDQNTDAQDAARVLSARGARQSQRAGAVVHKLTNVDHLYTSPRIRCRQTADLVGVAVRCAPEISALLDETVETAPRRVLELVSEGETSALVGHGPEWQIVVRKLTGKDVWLKRGGIAHLAIADGQATLRQLLQPADVKRML
jgi:phosphohistidine phosphatase SixA